MVESGVHVDLTSNSLQSLASKVVISQMFRMYQTVMGLNKCSSVIGSLGLLKTFCIKFPHGLITLSSNHLVSVL